MVLSIQNITVAPNKYVHTPPIIIKKPKRGLFYQKEEEEEKEKEEQEQEEVEERPEEEETKDEEKPEPHTPIYDPCLCKKLYPKKEYDCKCKDGKHGDGDYCDPFCLCEGDNLKCKEDKCQKEKK